MKRMPWKVMATSAAASLLLASGCSAVGEKENGRSSEAPRLHVPVADDHFDTAGNMFAYSEFELSGEPLAEGLGLDLDTLDARKPDKPTKFDYTAGIESYEYSEEAMYEVTEKSGLGLHLINGPIAKQRAEQRHQPADQALADRFYELADSVGYPREELFRNMFPTFIEYAGGDPHYAQKVDTGVYAENDDGTYVPVYQVDFQSLRWDRGKMDKVLTPSAYGGVFLKQALWAGDFLGNFHQKDSDEEVEAKTPNDDQSGNIALGVSSADGMQGMILTEQIWNKLAFIRDHLFYDAKQQALTKAAGSRYNPSGGFVYLPHAVEVAEGGSELAPDAAKLVVKDPRSLLEDQWLMLWPAAEFFGMTDQRPENKNQNPAFLAVFDGKPFPSAPKENLDATTANDRVADDPYSVNRDVLLQVFRNIDAMHFNEKAGAFVTEHDGRTQGNRVDTFQAGYTMEALRIFERAIDGMPVGYASGESAKGLGTPEGKRALELIRRQADFIMHNLMRKDGLVENGYTIGQGPDQDEPTLLAQLGAIRGLTAAFLATKDEAYRDAARRVYEAMNKHFWDQKWHVYHTGEKEDKYTPWLAGALSGVFRVALQNLNNDQADETAKSLDRETIISRYVDFYDRIVDGPTLQEGMQASEFWDTGDVYIKGKKLGNTDHDHVPQVQAAGGPYGVAPVLRTVKVNVGSANK
ncbi:hypothetical protein QWV57_14585 [Geobacillus zalihae]|uniref:Extracellular membrane-anchored protein n=1 Tax=Geobacillus zalihae TaxID=213419 RepID=A0A1V9BZM4_9BACL|nr:MULTISPECIES: hypothetical protein [Geobacillus]AGE23453.1 hypothetical protein GHH_c29420 [Geobacillus sp. GHH01]OQP14668.1 hypothetical protein B1693_14900 [Geobacillus zalihae]OQP23068.1 hypothetical protein B1694_09180 [Geobacillus zalihae]QNU16906.1 hypothetical protein IC807_10490 [Geobacillus zalihae]QNU26022.1 hypothetical protein IC806_07355 [Geobacillus zalihae]